MKRETLFIAAALALMTSPARADRVTNFTADISTAPDRTLTIRTITTWNGDTHERAELVFSPEALIQKDCNPNWKCEEGKGSTRYWHIAAQKPGGHGYILIKVIGQYESTRWASITLVDEEGNKSLEKVTPGCQDLYSNAKQLIVVDTTKQGWIDPTGEPPPGRATSYDPQTGKAIGSLDFAGHGTWELLARNECGLRYGDAD